MAYNHDSDLTADSLCLSSEQLTETSKIIAHAIAKKNKTSRIIEEVITKIGVSEDSMKLVLAHALVFLASRELRTLFGEIVAKAKEPDEPEATNDAEKEEHKCEECDAESCPIRTAPYSGPASDDVH